MKKFETIRLSCVQWSRTICNSEGTIKQYLLTTLWPQLHREFLGGTTNTTTWWWLWWCWLKKKERETSNNEMKGSDATFLKVRSDSWLKHEGSIDQCHVCSLKSRDQVPSICFESCHFVSTLPIMLGVVRCGGAAPSSLQSLHGRLEPEATSCSLKWKYPLRRCVVVVVFTYRCRREAHGWSTLTGDRLPHTGAPSWCSVDLATHAMHDDCPTMERINVVTKVCDRADLLLPATGWNCGSGLSQTWLIY